MQRTNRNQKPLLSVEETAILLGETRSTLYRAAKAGTLPFPVFRIGSRIRIPRSAVERLIAGMTPGQSASSTRPTQLHADGQPDADSSLSG
jgi:excisionase family DNA binding protein